MMDAQDQNLQDSEREKNKTEQRATFFHVPRFYITAAYYKPIKEHLNKKVGTGRGKSWLL
jgi:hypothetical protein